MSLTVVYPQWRDQQRHDRSPFSDRVDVPDGLDEIFVDAALHCYGATGHFIENKTILNVLMIL